MEGSTINVGLEFEALFGKIDVMKALLGLLCPAIAVCLSAEGLAANSNGLVRVAAAQAARRVVDFRLTNSTAVLAEVEKNLDALEGIVKKAGAQKCDVLVLPEDTPGLLNWVGVNEPLLKEVLPKAVSRMIQRLGAA